jgi:hypothetical protein
MDDQKFRVARVKIAKALVGLRPMEAIHALRAPNHFAPHDKDNVRTREERRAIGAIRDAVRQFPEADGNLLRDEVSLMLLDRPVAMGDITQLAAKECTRFGVEWMHGRGVCFVVRRPSEVLAVLCLHAGMQRADVALFGENVFVWFPVPS